MTTGEISHGGTAIPGWLRTTETSAQLSSGSARVLAIGLASAMISLGVWLLISSPEQAGSPRDEQVAEVVPKATPPASQEPGEPAPAGHDPAAAEKLAARGQTAYKSGSRSSARKLFNDALALDPDNAVALMGLSNLSFDSGKYSSATSYARRAVKVAPRNADYRVRLGDAYFKQGKHDRARAQYQRAAKLGHPFAARRLKQLPGS